MADQLQIRGGDTASNSTFTGAQRELSIDTSKNQLIVHDGVTPGGHPIPNTDDPTFTGDAEFSGSITADGDIETTGKFQSHSDGDNYIPTVNGQNGAGLDQIYLDAPGGRVFSVKGDGSGTFAGVVQGSFFDCKSDRSGSTNISRWDSAEGPEVIKFGADGSATFADSVTAGPGGVGNTSTGTGVKLFPGGSVYASQSAGTSPVFYGMLNNGNTETSRINGNGSAQFVGEVTVGDQTTENYTKLYSNGGIRCYRAASDSEGFAIYDPSGAKVQLYMDGSATFAGKVTSDQSTVVGALKVGTGLGPTSGVAFTCGGSDQISFLPNGNATFTGAVSASNITAFKSRMASAVASAGDLAALKQAILDAVADL